MTDFILTIEMFCNNCRATFPKSEEIDYKNSQALASGVDCLIVNGKVVLRDGKLTEKRCGRVLKKID